MALVPSIFVDVEEGANCPYSLQLVFSALDAARGVRQVRLYHESADGPLYDVAGWNNDSEPSEASGVAVEDSGQGRAYLIYGGNGGIRLRSASSEEPWDISASEQWGRSHMVLSDVEDIVWADS